MESDLLRGETDLLVFISSVMRDELNRARKLTVHAFRKLQFAHPWAFEYTPASSEPPDDGYLRKVAEADFVVWLIGRETTQPVVNEISTCISAGRRLLALKLPSETRDECTQNLMGKVSDYAKWRSVDNIEELPRHINVALSDEIVRAIRDPAPPARIHELTDQRKHSVSRCKEMWIALGVPDSIAADLSHDQSIGDMLEWPNQGLHMVVGDQGAGKTLALERLFQRLITRALDDSSQPFPLFVSARRLRETLIEYVERMSQGYSRPSVQGTAILIDGLDEIGVTAANALLEQVAAYTGANSRATAIVTSRSLPGLKSIGEQIAMPTMSDERVISLISRVSGREFDMRVRHAWSDSTWDAAKLPLFAVMIGSELRENSEPGMPQPSQLVNRLAERTWQEAGDNAEVVDELLQILAVQAISTGARVILSSVTHRKLQQRWLTDSRLVNEHAGTVDFTIPIFREWYAARALIEQTVSVEDILPASDRWIIPLAIAIDSEDEDLGRRLMVRIASSDPGLASLLLKERGDRWYSDGTDEPSLGTAVEVGEEIRNAMVAWGRGLGRLYPVIGPVAVDGTTATLGIRLNAPHITTSWYSGSKEMPAVLGLPGCIGWNKPNPDWPGLSSRRVPRTKAWPWVMTKCELVNSLSETIRSKGLALGSTDAIRELNWAFALAVKEQGELNPKPIDIHYVLRCINYINDNVIGPAIFKFGLNAFSTKEVRIVKHHLSELVEGGENFITEPWPPADQLDTSGLVWGFYSEQRLLERANAVYAGALRIYENMVDRWFKAFGARLRLNQLLPVRLEGRLTLPPQQDTDNPWSEPFLDWRPRCLPVDAKSEVDFELGPRGEFHDNFERYWREEESKLKRLRPGDEAAHQLFQTSSALEVFDSRPATELAHDWLKGELQELNWAEL